MSERREFVPHEVELTTIEKLPPLKEGFCRLVHITHPGVLAEIKENGLHYKNGMLMSTARIWQHEADCEYWSDDPRFSFDGAVAVVMDIPIEDSRRHNDYRKSPGKVSEEYIVGFVPAKKPVVQ